ncbi:MAG TPA: carbon storage regulator CsrA [Armatimonadota bacterium]|nr:carbon storage regulator CsrA [Armatimonadota bacterium]
MLVLARKTGQRIVIGGEIEITVLDIRGDQVRLGIEAPRSIAVHRKELLEQGAAENAEAAATPEVTAAAPDAPNNNRSLK